MYRQFSFHSKLKTEKSFAGTSLTNFSLQFPGSHSKGVKFRFGGPHIVDDMCAVVKYRWPVGEIEGL